MHPHKFTLWIGIGSIVMMFAGLTSAYIVKRSQSNWRTFDIPVAFWISTGVILLSSLLMMQALKSFQERNRRQYRVLLGGTLICGLAFIGLQAFGFWQLWQQGVTLQANVAFSFLYVIVALHAAHVTGGVIALAVMTIKSYSRRERNYSAVPVEVISTYWHFVDGLWIYLLLFLLMIK